ncbi:hypothetical protein JZ751_027374 [Albula glossodonta]|uniref:Uncharacterized protein n=1 Tax=Albula glossodonta TaxID=121402 RepID=A0A8T2MNS8_9TELE|nr:hypothetical protein JZ751_027374 [Albula glossodonta]
MHVDIATKRATVGGAPASQVRTADPLNYRPSGRPSDNMLHPFMWGILSINTSMTLIYWIVLLAEIFIKVGETEPDASPLGVLF